MEKSYLVKQLHYEDIMVSVRVFICTFYGNVSSLNTTVLCSAFLCELAVTVINGFTFKRWVFINLPLNIAQSKDIDISLLC